MVLQTIGLFGSSGKIALFMEDSELAKAALSCHIALDMLCQEMHDICLLRLQGEPTVAVSQAFSPWLQQEKARDVVREMKGKGRRRRSDAQCPSTNPKKTIDNLVKSSESQGKHARPSSK